MVRYVWYFGWIVYWEFIEVICCMVRFDEFDRNVVCGFYLF